jgi:hypothetical protein
MALDRLADAIRAEGGLLAAALVAPAAEVSPAPGGIGQAPRTADHPADLELVFEAVREGYLLHHGTPRILGDEDPDLALLAGDRLYALGLERLAAVGDLPTVRALADLIALGASAAAAGDEALADAVWDAAAAEVGWGPHEALEPAKDAARAGESRAGQALRAAAVRTRSGA